MYIIVNYFIKFDKKKMNYFKYGDRLLIVLVVEIIVYK
jgi:hypothetical protein